MELGGVIIWFNPEQIKGAGYDSLFAVYQSLSKINFRTMVVARPGMAMAITVAAWGHGCHLIPLIAFKLRNSTRPISPKTQNARKGGAHSRWAWGGRTNGMSHLPANESDDPRSVATERGLS